MSVAGDVLQWVARDVVAPDAYSRLVNVLGRRSTRKKLYSAVKRSVGFRPGRAFKKWLKTKTTQELLVQCSQAAYDQLVESLSTVLAEKSNTAVALVDATISEYMQTLEPAMAAHVAEERAAYRHGELHAQGEEILAQVTADSSFEAHLTLIPPQARLLLADHSDLPATKHLASAVALGDPREVIVSLSRTQPGWLRDAPAVTYAALAALANSYDRPVEAAQAYVAAAERGHHPATSYAMAAYFYKSSGDDDQAIATLATAKSIDASPIIETIAAAIANDAPGLLAGATREQVLDELLAAALYSQALHMVHGVDAAALFLTDAVDRWPESSWLTLELARRLWERSQTPGVGTRDRDQAAARQLAVRARDLARSWRGNSVDAAVVACALAVSSSDLPAALRLGRVPPDGEATPSEASAPQMQMMVADAALAGDDIVLVEGIAAVSEGFNRALLDAGLLVKTGAPKDEIETALTAAFALAETSADRAAVWVAAADAALDPIPGQAQLDQEPELSVLVRGRQLVAMGRFSDAATHLRAYPSIEVARDLLASVYVEMDDISAAVAELRDMAEVFDNPNHELRAIRILANAGRLDESALLADNARASTPPDHHAREFLHDVGVVAAARRPDWPDLERRVRAWNAEAGPDDRRTWLLVLALLNQAEPDTAWQVLQSMPDSAVTTPVEAQAWIVLHARERPGAATRTRALELCDQFDGDPDVRKAATNAKFLMGDDDDITPEELARWQELIALRAEQPGEDDTFEVIAFPDDVDGITEFFRSRLEGQAVLLHEWIEQVRHRGWPYGMLALVAGRPYAAALAHRAAGCLPVATADADSSGREVAAATAALSGTVIADLSALTTCFYISDRWPTLRAAFARVELTSGSRFDAGAASSATAGPESAGMLIWDVDVDRPIFVEQNLDQVEQLRQHLAWVQDEARTLPVRVVNATADDDDPPAPWKEALEAARDAGLPFWADDLGLRVLAAQEGVATFGTYALLAALEQNGSMSPIAVSMSLNALRDQYCVDLPLDADWLVASAEADQWGPGPALATFTRPATWIDRVRSYEIWRRLAQASAEHDKEFVARWGYSAALGIAISARGGPAEYAQSVLSALLAACAGVVDYEPEPFARCAEAVAQAAAEESLDDPTEHALGMFFDLMSERADPGSAATAVSTLGSRLIGEQREALRRVVLGNT